MNNETPKVTIIIPFKRTNALLIECLEYIAIMKYPDYEVILLPDESGPIEGLPDAVILPTGPIPPSAKRDMGARNATGEILAFIDDDAYPDSDWLSNAVISFSDPSIAAVGGPGITPPSDSITRQASGVVYESLLGGGPHSYRYVAKSKRFVDDYPTCNLLIRKSVFMEAGGFGTDYWPGEDTKLCLKITKHLKKFIIYDPSAVVYHHRRPVLMGHLKQVASYAVHRGFFAKRFPETSRRISYFLPSFAIIFAMLVVAGSIAFQDYWVLVFLVVFYNLGVLVSTLMSSARNPALIVLSHFSVVATHVVYGIWFLKGLFSKTLNR